MKIFEKMWWIFGLLTIGCYFLNPYIGLFALFPLGTTFITFCVFVNIKMRNKKVVAKQTEVIEKINGKVNIVKENFPFKEKLEKVARVQKKILSKIMYVWVILFGLINVFPITIIWILASGNLGVEAKYTTHLIIWSETNIYSTSITLLILGIIFSVLTCVSSFSRLLTLERKF